MRQFWQPESFSVDYAVLRQRFLDAARQANAVLSEYEHPLPGPDGGRLVTDVAFLGERAAARMLVIISGTHGVEGQFGSACQTEWLSSEQSWQLPEDASILMIHLVNPWGTAWSRRVNEDNVDLNRNFIDWDGAVPRNDAYAELHQAFVFAEWSGAARDRADISLLEARRALGQTGLAAVVEAGQYELPDGMYYGGAGPTWSNRTLNDILRSFAQDASDVIVFDLHTGAGPYGYPALLSVADEEHDGLDWGRSLFGPALSIVKTGKSATTQTGIAATATGYVSLAVRKAMPASRVMPLVIECGTLEGAIVMDAIRADNWLHMHGDVSSALGQEIKEALRTAFIPKDADWQRTCLTTGLRYFDRALAELNALPARA